MRLSVGRMVVMVGMWNAHTPRHMTRLPRATCLLSPSLLLPLSTRPNRSILKEYLIRSLISWTNDSVQPDQLVSRTGPTLVRGCLRAPSIVASIGFVIFSTFGAVLVIRAVTIFRKRVEGW